MWCGRSRRRQGSESRRRSQLNLAALEALEPRRLLSTDIVTNLNDSGLGSLRQTIASASAGDTVQFASSLAGGTIVLSTGELVVGQSLTITGLGASNLSISGNNASTIFAISAATNVSISGLTITEGNAGVGEGGGIYNDGSLTLTNCALTADNALINVSTALGFTGGDAGNGGGIFNDAAGTLTMSGTTISGSRADVGGAIYNNGGRVTMTNCVLSNSSAEQGAGLLNTAGGTVNITGSSITQNDALEEAGGGICNENSTLTITGSIVSSNTATTYGGGIANLASGTLTVSSTVLQGDTANQYGGGIFNFTGATVTINNGSTLSSDKANGLFGGGLFDYEGTANIANSTVSGGTSTFVGGGIADFAGTINISGSNFSNNGNFTDQAGGALYVFADTVTIDSSTFSSNEAQLGGAIYQDNNSSLIVSNSTLQNNVAQASGGGALISSTAFFFNDTISGNQAENGGGLISFGVITLVNSTIAGNVASVSGGGINIQPNDSATLYNTIVAINTLSNNTTPSDIAGTLDHILAAGQTRSSNDLIGTGGSGGLSNGVRHNIVGANPDLGALQNNGGATNTMALQTGSPAINAGANGLAVNANGVALTTDQRGAGFARIVGGTVDIGAYEVQSNSSGNSPALISSSPLIPATALQLPNLLVGATNATPDFINLGEANPAAASATTAPYSPSQIVSAYGVNDIFFNGVVGNGAGQTIAIIDAFNDPDILSDANAFSAQFGLPQFNGAGEPTLKVLNQSGGTALPANSTPGQWDLEESLDVEWAHAIAPGANIILFEANSSATSDLFTAVSTAADTVGVSTVSMSFSTPQLLDFYGGVTETTEDSIFTTPVGHQGVTFFGSTGDDGAPAVGYPALSPNVVAVGGTTLTIGTDGSYIGESAWSGSGGGTAIQESQPSFQSASINSTGARATPDVSMDADPESGVYVLDSFDGGYTQVGGTSLSTPMWAALIAIVDQGRALKGESSLDGPTQTLPMLYDLPSSDFHDILTGNDGYPAASGYDLATGLGTPNVGLLVPALAGYSATEIWTGAVSNNWYTPGNWNTDTVPGSTTNVIINFGSPTAGVGFTIGSLTINGGTLDLGTNSGGSTVTSLAITGSGTLDIGNNHLFIDFSGADPISTVRGYLTTGYAGGLWNGAGIDSSAAAVTPGYGVGYADGSDGVVTGLSSGQIEIQYALYGDANLDGTVSGADFSILAANLGQSVNGWDKGDFNYDGVDNGEDFSLLISNLDKSAANADIATPSIVNLSAAVTTVTAATTLNPVLMSQPKPKIITARPLGAANVSVHPSNAHNRVKVRWRA
jgi:hypothetical protein